MYNIIPMSNCDYGLMTYFPLAQQPTTMVAKQLGAILIMETITIVTTAGSRQQLEQTQGQTTALDTTTVTVPARSLI